MKMSIKKYNASITLMCLLVASLIWLLTPSGIYNFARPMLLSGGGEMCLKSLQERNIQHFKLGDLGSGNCPIRNAVRVIEFSQTRPSKPMVLSCPTVIALDDWFAEANVKTFKHAGTVNCRKVRGSRVQSEHSYGTAIDIISIDGVSIKKRWDIQGSESQKLKKAAKLACNHFSNVLTPETNSLHHDHFHFDIGIGAVCGKRRF